MFQFAISIGIYSYLIFFIGLFGLLSRPNVILTTLVYVFFSIVYFSRKHRIQIVDIKIKRLNKLSKFIIFLLFTQAFVNFIGALGPEISFDALWYHLTLPKIYLENKSIFHIPGGLLYYSDIPKLMEMIYIGALSFGDEILAKLIHFGFGILVLVTIYKLSRKFLSQDLSLIATLIFYSNLVVGWLSITAYVDLARTFFEALVILAFIIFTEKNDKKYFLLSAIILGFAITTKLASFASIGIFLLLFIYKFISDKESLKMFFINIFSFSLITLIISLPWFFSSYLNTGNPLYPYFSIPVDSGNFINIPNLFLFPQDIFTTFLNLNDPISPIYLIFLPLILIVSKNTSSKYKYLYIYVFASFLIWYLTQYFRGTRFLLPYLPVFSILCAYAIHKTKNVLLRNYLIALAILVSIVSVGYRGLANAKYLPVIFENESKAEFLTKNLNFSYGDFYDVDGYFRNNIKDSDKVLLYGFHNLYYIDFPFIHSTWVKKGDKFNYIAVQNSIIPSKFSDWKEIYYNKQTKVGLYAGEGREWVY